jgi:two-component system chemotaxis response regulator CheY
MPHMGGLETLKLIRQIEKTSGISEQDRVAVIITSSNDEAACIDSARDEGCQAYLIKPIRKQELFAEIKRLGLIEQAELPGH